MIKNYIKKADIILLIILVACGLCCSIVLSASKTIGDTVIIEKNGELYGKYSLSNDTEIDVIETSSVGSNVHVSIKNNHVKVTKSGCQNQICVRHSAIDSIGESIVCLPNHVIVKIEGKGGGYDSVTK